MPEMRYDAFISYSHKDMHWGRWVQKRLERFHLPRQLRAESANGGTGLHIFRDQTDLAGVELQSTLHRELEASRFMIVICSPDSAASRWVGEEIRYFKQLGRTDCIIPFIVSGEPESDDPSMECYPEELRNVEERHFMCANIREIGKNKALLRVLSVLLDIRFDRLSDRITKHRRMTTAIATAACVLVGAVIGGLMWRNAEITRENEKNIRKYYEMAHDVYWSAMVSEANKAVMDPEKLEIVRAAADGGDVKAMYYMGLMAYYGTMNGTVDQQLAFSWFLKGAEAGDPVCMAAVGTRCLNGEGVDPDPEKGFAWNMKAAQAGSAEGMLNVAVCFELGQGTAVDENEAVAWYLKAAEAGSTYAMRKVATEYLMGLHGHQDIPQAVDWVRKAAENGDAEGMAMLALCYQNGIVVEQNAREATRWYRRAAEGGDPDGMYWTAWCLENGYGVSDEVIEWYQRAAELGQQDAVEAVRRLTAPMTK